MMRQSVQESVLQSLDCSFEGSIPHSPIAMFYIPIEPLVGFTFKASAQVLKLEVST
jgi:hypothetical protein